MVDEILEVLAVVVEVLEVLAVGGGGAHPQSSVGLCGHRP